MMKKIDLAQVKQKDQIFYSMVIDPRIIVELLSDVKPGETQEVQRPWTVKKVKEISSYVAGKVKLEKKFKVLGIIPNNPIIAISKPFEVKKEFNKESKEDKYYLEMPETDEEKKMYKGKIEVIDGQHRLRAFSKEYRDPLFSDTTDYNMIFAVFDNLSINQRKEIFMFTNEKQDKVSTNLIRLLKKALGLLGEEEKIFDIVNSLNDESYSPLYKRIIFGEEKISKGYKENQLSKILEKSNTLDTLEKYSKNEPDKMIRMISNYLKSWETIYGLSFQNPGKETLTKISGIRYIMYLFPEIMELLVKNKKNAIPENFEDIIEKLPVAVGIEDIFDNNLAFRGEGATIKLAKEHSKKLVSYILSKNDEFDPTEGI